MINLRIKYKTIISEWILFLINPFAASLIALRNYRLSFTKNIIWLFVAYYGFTLVISNEGMDANRYREVFISLANSDLNLRNIEDLLYQEGSGFVDVAQLLISFIVSRFTRDPRILFAVFGLVFGYFYSRNIWFLFDRTGTEIKRTSLIYIFVFAITVGFWNLSGFRMYTAAQLFFFGAIQYLLDNRMKGIIIAALSILFHFSFLFPVGLLLLFMVMPKKAGWFFWLLIITFFISEIDVRIFSDKLTSILPGIFHQRIEGYTSEAYIDAVAEAGEARNWRFHFYNQSIKWASTGLLSLIYFNGMKFLKGNINLNRLFCFALLLMSSVNLISTVPSMQRFYSVGYMFIFAFLYLYFQHAPDFRLRKAIQLIAFPLLLFYCLGMINISLMTIGMITVIGNPIVAIMPYSNFDFAIIELLK